MKRARFIVVVLGAGLTMMSYVMFAQAPEGQSGQGVQLMKHEIKLIQEPVPESSAIPTDQQPTKEQLAKLFEVMRLREQLQSYMKMIPAMVQKQIKAQAKDLTSKLPGGGTITPELQATIDRTMDKYLEKALNLYPVDEMLDDLTTIYQRHLSRSDVDAFIVFYQSPAGQHLLDQQPAIMKEYMPVVMDRMQQRSKALTDELTREMEELSKTPAAEKQAAK
ncbi:MAG: DUF2059 domain-containing protein [Terracidiphilus sp.]